MAIINTSILSQLNVYNENFLKTNQKLIIQRRISRKKICIGSAQRSK